MPISTDTANSRNAPASSSRFFFTVYLRLRFLGGCFEPPEDDVRFAPDDVLRDAEEPLRDAEEPLRVARTAGAAFAALVS